MSEMVVGLHIVFNAIIRINMFILIIVALYVLSVLNTPQSIDMTIVKNLNYFIMNSSYDLSLEERAT
ncbi:hypothetical protein [Clostridium sp. FP1]|uniref:hypothetical protein n=1 Tax=Clostridium sp. FP1 TaxID=2724076 RepID=UPI0013E99558|nr:hypothetical protein [Clostridium sp. FP1]MBZ9637689.1 hypothetical protein [Clostridium sp. FP1]